MNETMPAPALPPSAVAPGAPRLIAIASGKGGVGKTWFAITLSQALARLGHRTLLFDGDLGLANVDIQLGLMPQRDLGSVLAGRIALGEAVQPCADGQFDVIAGRSGSGRLASLAPEALRAMTGELRALSSRYDRVVLDLGAGIERTVRLLARSADAAVVVATAEPTSLTDAYAFIKVTARDGAAETPRIVVNMAASRDDGEATYETLRKACRSFLNTSPALLGVVRRDPKVREAIRHQVPLLHRHPNSDAARDVEAIAARLVAHPARPAAPGAAR
jgi:flagellar biosynthesis protein FlhG